MDGMTLSFHKNQARLVHAFSVPEQQTPGTAFSVRVFLPDRSTRGLLLDFCSGGVTCRLVVAVCDCWCWCWCSSWCWWC